MTKRGGWILFIGGLIVLIVFIGYLAGYRFSAMSAARANSFVGQDATPFATVPYSGGKIILFNTPTGPRTVMANKTGLLWRAPISTYLGKPHPGPIATVGWMSSTNNHHAITLIAVTVNTSRIGSVSIGPTGARETQTVRLRTPLIFRWNTIVPFNSMNPIAFSRTGKPLYRYGSSKHTTGIFWYAISPSN